jgi:hypothetical protein
MDRTELRNGKTWEPARFQMNRGEQLQENACGVTTTVSSVSTNQVARVQRQGSSRFTDVIKFEQQFRFPKFRIPGHNLEIRTARESAQE